MTKEIQKPVTHKVGELPVNSRIFIKYPKNGDKATIDFEYPDTADQIKSIRHSSSVYILSLLITCLLFFCGYVLYDHYLETLPGPSCKITTYSNSSTVIQDTTGVNNGTPLIFQNDMKNFFIMCFNEGITNTKNKDYYLEAGMFDLRRNLLQPNGIWTYRSYAGYNSKGLNSSFKRSFRLVQPLILFGILYFVLMYIISSIISLFVRKTKVGQKYYPLVNKIIHNKRWMAEFNSCPDNLTLELPLFHNMYMDYDAEGEFAEYLTDVQIVEHDVKYIKEGRKKFNDKRLKTKPNVYLWKTVFKFSKKPTNGKIIVRFT